MMVKKKEVMAKERIIEAAIEEFSKYGLNGTRVEQITKKANINKAMLFYYFGSKKNLYELIVKKTVKVLLSSIRELILPNLSAETFLERFPAIYIDFFSRNRHFVNMLSLDMIQNPEFMTRLFSNAFKEKFGDKPAPLEQMVNRWFENGEISESSSTHFMLNIMSLVIFPFIFKPIPEAILGKTAESDQTFFEYRKKSIENILKRGLLT